jgi:chromosomal replication initiation ATPase DnaA
MNEQTNENTEYQNLWNKCLEIFKDNVTEVVYQTWFSPIIPLSWSKEEHTLRIQVPTTFFQEMLDAQYSQLLYATLTRVFGKGGPQPWHNFQPSVHLWRRWRGQDSSGKCHRKENRRRTPRKKYCVR